MRRYLWDKLQVGLLLCVCCACADSKRPPVAYNFENDTILPCTSVLNQGWTSTCWAYATASLLESDLLAVRDDTVRLSVMFVVRQKYLNQFDAYCYSRGREEIRNGGLGHSFLRVLKENGIVPWEAYRGQVPGKRGFDHRNLLKGLKHLAEKAVKEKDFQVYRKRAIALLDREMGPVPESFIYKGVRYTPLSFADSLHLNPEGYVQLASVSHHPYYEPFVLEVPDNWEHACYLNLPLDELEQTVRKSLRQGRTVVWHGDVSEKTFSNRYGVAVWPYSSVTQDTRQKGFENFTTTDDHMMHIVGTAHDEAGDFYYLLKNSYGKNGAYDGFIYMSEDYFRAKTISVLLSAEFVTHSENVSYTDIRKLYF